MLQTGHRGDHHDGHTQRDGEVQKQMLMTAAVSIYLHLLHLAMLFPPCDHYFIISSTDFFLSLALYD